MANWGKPIFAQERETVPCAEKLAGSCRGVKGGLGGYGQLRRIAPCAEKLAAMIAAGVDLSPAQLCGSSDTITTEVEKINDLYIEPFAQDLVTL